ncbi:MAG: hypothetical protein AAFR47_00365 [Pseudomonadota bacterium]
MVTIKAAPAFAAFLKDESGAVTVDWVVLTAALAGMGIAVALVLGSQFAPASQNLGTFLGARTISTTFN